MRLPLAFVMAAVLTPPTAPVNLDFEIGTPGQTPAGWWTASISGPGFRAVLVNRECAQGRNCAVLGDQSTSVARSSGSLYKVVPAEPYRGRRVRIRAAVRVEGPDTSLRLCLRTDRRGRDSAYRSSEPISDSKWVYRELEGEIASDGERILFGFQLSGPGKVWIDDVTLSDQGRPAPKASGKSRRKPAPAWIA
jgi:hypothetical protein